MARFEKETDIHLRRREGNVQNYMRQEVQKMKPHFHYQCEMIVTTDGTAVFNVNGRDYTLTRGSILCISNLENHYIASHDGAYARFTLRFSNEILYTLIHDPVLLSLFKQRPETFCHQIECSPREIEHYEHMCRIMVREYEGESPYWEYMVASKFQDILVYLFRGHPEAFPGIRRLGRDQVIFDIQNYVESSLSEDLSLETVASRFYISKFHLSHTFSEVTGYTYKHYVVMARLSRAKDLLLHTSKEVQEIAGEVGFASATHFIRAFKGQEGISPLQYRNRART